MTVSLGLEDFTGADFDDVREQGVTQPEVTIEYLFENDTRPAIGFIANGIAMDNESGIESLVVSALDVESGQEYFIPATFLMGSEHWDARDFTLQFTSGGQVVISAVAYNGAGQHFGDTVTVNIEQ